MSKLGCFFRTTSLATFFFAIPQARSSPPVDRRGALEDFLRAQGYMAVPMRENGTGHLVLAAEINGVHVFLLVDSGSTRTALDRARSVRLALTLQRGAATVTGVSVEKQSVDVAILERLKVGAVEDRRTPTAVLDLSVTNINIPTDQQVDGILGSDFLLQHSAVMDFKKRVLYLKGH